ncbi:MAG: hypothetical protein K0S34_2412 [Bacillales bacterium]|nr:hypothetical protein [Bacillales bacterium]
MIVGVVIAVIVIHTFFFKGKIRKIGMVLAVVIIIAYSILFVARPFWIDAQINKKVDLIRPYLEERYPDEKWTISTVDHRYFKNKHKSPYTISVTFKSEPDVTYFYHVGSKDNIKQGGYSKTNELKQAKDLKHLEFRKPR